MGKKTLKRQQKLYKMKGCSKRKSRKHGRTHRGGSGPLAYTGEKIHFQSNPFLAYTGKGGAGTLTPETIMYTNTNGVDKTMPNTGPEFQGSTPTNTGFIHRGGTCNTCSNINMTGGGCDCGKLFGGGRGKLFGGGRGKLGGCGPTCLSGGNNLQKGGTWAPQGFVGKSWTPTPSGWPGVNSSRNYLDYNQYKVDPQTAMVNVGPNPPFLNGGKKRRGKKSRKQRGGALFNFLTQDVINLARQAQFGVGSTYNGINGYSRPVNPLPWKDQLPHGSSINALL